jgi:hypothetical protein
MCCLFCQRELLVILYVNGAGVACKKSIICMKEPVDVQFTKALDVSNSKHDGYLTKFLCRYLVPNLIIFSCLLNGINKDSKGVPV